MNFLLRKSYLLNITTVVILLKISIIHKSVSHFLKSVFILNFSGPYFLSFELNKEIYGVNLRIQSECEKNGPKKLRIRSFINSSSCEELSKYLVDLYSEPSQTSKMSKFFVKTVHGFSLQKQPQEVFYKKGIPNNFTKFTEPLFLWICSLLLRKPLTENFVFYAVIDLLGIEC